MRVLRRHNEADEARADAAEGEAEAAEAEARDDPGAAGEAGRPTATSARRTFLPGWRRRGDGGSRAGDDDAGADDSDRADDTEPVDTGSVDTEPVDRADDTEPVDTGTVDTEPVDERDRTEPAETRPVTTESEIRTELWSWADAAVSVIGAGLALVGLIVLARAGLDGTWYRPVVEVLDANHTAALGAAEVGAGVLLILAGVARSRVAAALVGLAIAIAGALAAIESSEVRRELAVEQWWAWILAGVGLLVAVVALVPPRRRRVERVLETR
jgi:hypothetical protein